MTDKMETQALDEITPRVATRECQGPFPDPKENKVLFAALDSFRQYRKTAHYNVTHRRRQNFYALPTAHWQRLSAPPISLLSTLERVDDAIDANSDLADKILNSALTTFGLKSNEHDPRDPSTCWRDKAESHHIDKARSTIRQMYRDWSAEGSVERQACYDPVLEVLEQEFAQLIDRCNAKVLVPGAGLGRLVFEICRRGYTVEGNEISWHQLIASNWVLNHTENGKTFDVYPFAGEFSNVISRDDQLKVVKVPDLHVGSVVAACSGISQKPSSERMNMRAGDFVSLYKGDDFREQFDAVVTVFFIDTAPNLIRYIETIQSCLKEGGVWINLGPLLWHFGDRGPPTPIGESKPDTATGRPAGIEEPGSFELTDEEVRELVRQMGFDIESHKLEEGTTGYIGNPESMLQSTYRLSHWVARRRS